VVDAQRGWIVTAGYCLQVFGTDSAQRISVRLWDGVDVSVQESKFVNNKLLALLHIDAPSLRQLDLSSHPLRAGDTVTELAFDLGYDPTTKKAASGQLRIALGRIVEVGRMSFIGDVPSQQRVGTGVRVILPQGGERAHGSAGAPLLDSEGNVACMTYQGGKGEDQCVAAEEIRVALKAIA
jgi:hypothetical protein